MGFFGILLLIFVGLWLLGRILPFLLVGLISRQQKRWANQFGGAGGAGGAGGTGGRAGGRAGNAKKEGEVTVEPSASQQEEENSAKVSKQVGEYVEYEEQQ